MSVFEDRDALADFNERMTLAVRQGGSLARLLQGRVANEGKADPTDLPNDDAALRARRAAKTIVDEAVQEVLLIAAQQALHGEPVRLDAEEETGAVSWFATSQPTERTLVLDPVDGTIEFIQGKDSYAICVGLADGGALRSALVHFPGRDVLYSLAADGSPVMCGSAYKGQRVEPLSASATPSRVVYKNGRVEATTVDRLVRAGFDVRDDTDGQIGAADAILACLSGNAVAYVSHTRQMRDILLGGIIGAIPGGYASDWRGRPLRWPAGGRVPRAVFGATTHLHAEVMECLSEHEEEQPA